MRDSGIQHLINAPGCKDSTAIHPKHTARAAARSPRPARQCLLPRAAALGWQRPPASRRGGTHPHHAHPTGAIPLSQTKLQSFLEANVSTAVGFGISWAVTPFVMGAFGYSVGAGTAFGITVVYTVISIIRGYLVRRFFNRMEVRR